MLPNLLQLYTGSGRCNALDGKAERGDSILGETGASSNRPAQATHHHQIKQNKPIQPSGVTANRHFRVQESYFRFCKEKAPNDA